MTTIAETTETRAEPPGPRWIDRIDRWCERFGDSVNPILVKETRQALKSRQFMITFSVLLVAALGWTVIGSLSMMPQIYTSPSAMRMLIGYYVVLAVPMLLVVPLAAYRSLEGEIDDGTLELLSITSLSPWQIVLGKLASASLQMLMYFVALFPCVAYAYTLRGVDLPTTLLMMAALLAAALLLTVIALFFAPLAKSRTGRIVTLLAVMVVLLGAEFYVGSLVVFMILEGNPLSASWTGFLVVFVVLTGLAFGHLLLTATAAQLTPESENRSTPLRWSLLQITSVLLGCLGFASFAFVETDIDAVAGLFVGGILFLTVLWTLCGSLMAAESATLTPRIRRELPQSFLARLMLSFLTPGPATGLIFASVGAVALAGVAYGGIRLFGDHPDYRMPAGIRTRLIHTTALFTAYLIGFWIAVRWVIAGVRIRNNPRVEIGIAALIAVAVLSALVPYSIGLHYHDYRSYEYSWWQVTNWVWTLGEALDGSLQPLDVLLVVVPIALALLANVAALGRVVLPRRLATPHRVRLERQESREGKPLPE